MAIFGYSAVFLIILAATGLIWLADVLTRRIRGQGLPTRTLVDYCRSFFPFILIVILIRSFLFEPFRIPSGSMVPTLLVGDFIVVNKFDYGLRLPVTNSVIVPIGHPQRGQVVVFRYPPNPSVDYIKRVVGLPGDQITYRGNRLWINGRLVPHTCEGRYHGPDGEAGSLLCVEQLGSVRHDILITPGLSAPDGTYTVPPHHYFMMGDNRDDSSDSRYWGTVPSRDLVGRAVLIWFNWDAFSEMPIWSRIGLMIH
ncbi:MAG: signal peptidase I [Gammaproteobacteria bacterium]